MFNDGIFIKGNKEGLTAVIDFEYFNDFDEMLRTLVEKLKKGEKFYRGASLKIITSLKYINDEQKKKMKNILFNEILIMKCIFENEDETESKFFAGVYEGKTKFIRKTVRGGQSINYSGNVVIIGDVNNGAEVYAGGNIIVLGCIKGQVHAGITGNQDAIIAALLLEPELLQIADIMTISPDEEKPKYPEIAKIEEDFIVVEPYVPNKYLSDG